VAAGIEVRELVDPVQDIGDQLLEEDAGRDADLAAERPGHSGGEVINVIVISSTQDPAWLSGPAQVEVASPAAEGTEGGTVETRQPHLHRPGIIEARLGGKVGSEALGQRREALDAARAVVERRRSRTVPATAPRGTGPGTAACLR
jgi:hypothetical protein